VFSDNYAYASLSQNNGAIYWANPKEIQFLSTEEIVSYYEEYHFIRYMSEAIPFAMDGSSNFLVIKKIEAKEVYIVNSGNLGWEDSNIISESVEEFLNDSTKPENYL
jgi:hypothetical protein